MTVVQALLGIILTSAKEHLLCQTRLGFRIHHSLPGKKKGFINGICVALSPLKGALLSPFSEAAQLLETMSQFDCLALKKNYPAFKLFVALCYEP